MLWQPGDPIERRTKDGHIWKFLCFAKRGTEYSPNQEFSYTYYPYLSDSSNCMKSWIYATPINNQKYCDELGMKLIGELHDKSPNSDVKLDVVGPMEFVFRIGERQITATILDKKTGYTYNTSFEHYESNLSQEISLVSIILNYFTSFFFKKKLGFI
jgi:hypothetical protein